MIVISFWEAPGVVCSSILCCRRQSCLSDAGVRSVDAQRVAYTPHHALDCSWPVLHWTVQIQLLTTQGAADWSLWNESFLVQRTIFEMITAKMDHSFQIYDFWIAIHWTLLSRLGWRMGRGQCTYTCKNEWSRWEKQKSVCTGNSGMQETVCICEDMIAQVYVQVYKLKKARRGKSQEHFKAQEKVKN